MKTFGIQFPAPLLGCFTFVAAFIFACTLLVSPSLARQEKKDKYDVTGTWQGKFPTDSNERDEENPVAVQITVKNDDNKISGRSIFYVIVNRDNKKRVIGSSESDLLDPRFDGTTLTFFVETKAQPGNPSQRIEMRMRMTGPAEAELENREDSSSPVIKMKKVQDHTANT